EAERVGSGVDALIPAAEELEVLEHQTSAAEVNTSVFNKGIPRHSKVLRDPSSDSAVGVDGDDEVAARSKLLRQVRVSFVVRRNDVVKLSGRISFSSARASAKERVISSVVDPRSVRQWDEDTAIFHRAIKCSTGAVIPMEENNQGQCLHVTR